MKKITLALLCIIGIVFASGCKKEVKPDEPETPVTPDNTKPSLSIINEEGYIANGDILQCGTSYNFGFIARSNSQTNAELSTLIILVDNEEKTNLNLSGTEYRYSDNISFHNDYPNDKATITAILTDIGGKEVSKSLQVQLQKNILEGGPSIAVMTGDNFIAGTVDYPTIIEIDDENAINLMYGFHVESNAGTQKELASLKLTWDLTYYDGDEPEPDTYETTIDLTGMTSYDYTDYLFEQEKGIITLMDGTITAVVTDVDNQTDTAVIAFTIEMVETPLMTSIFEWVRRGSNVLNEEEMASYGLKWTGSYKEVFATIEPLNDDVILYLCDGDDFYNIDFLTDKYVYFTNLAETATPIEKYRHISSQNSADYNDMLAVIYGDELTLIHISRAEIEIGTYGVQITIKGMVK